jgi:A118 family predicted phage portal protein
MDWALYPLAFDDDGNLADVVIPDSFTEGKKVYTRLERHTTVGRDVRITQRVFQSNNTNSLGTEIALSEVPRWASLQPEVVVKDTDGPLFGWYKVTSANNIDVDSPLGASVYAKAVGAIREADLQYSRLLWEFEGSELAIDVDPTVLKPKITNVNGQTVTEMPKLKERLFRAVDLGEDSTYKVFAPQIRDASLLNGLNQILIRVEDLCGLSRGTLSDANVDARTATELRIVKQRSYATIADNQKALEGCLRSVLRAMDKYATLYHLAPEGEYEVSFSWDDSIVTDSQQKMNEMLLLYNAQIISKQEFREWYFCETAAQAKAAIIAQQQEQMESLAGVLPNLDQGIPAP